MSHQTQKVLTRKSTEFNRVWMEEGGKIMDIGILDVHQNLFLIQMK